MISVQVLTKSYGTGQVAVANLSFNVHSGATLCIIGPSGCGKSTTLKMLNRLIEPCSGKIFVNEQNILEQDPVAWRRTIGYVMQSGGLFPHWTVAKNIALVPRLLKWEPSRIDNRVDELLHLVGLPPTKYHHRYPLELSGGEQQRVVIARALAANPEIILLDEPFSALDPITRNQLQNEFIRLKEQLGKTIVFVTHDVNEAIKIGSKILVMNRGQKVQLASPAEIINNPVDDFVASFIGRQRS